MSRYKRMNCPLFFSNIDWFMDGYGGVEEELLGCGYIKSDPIFGRDGWYYDRYFDVSWYEFANHAWWPPPKSKTVEQFKYELNQLNTPWLTDEVIKAIKTLQVHRICPRELSDLLGNHLNNVTIRNIYRNSKVVARQILGK